MENNTFELTIVPGRDILQINNAKICYKNFRGEGSMYNNEGDRNFSLIIPDDEIADVLRNNVNEYGAGWNVKIRAPREDEDRPFMHMKVTVKYTERSQPNIYLVSGKNMIKLTEEMLADLDDIRIEKVDLDIRPYDGESRFGAFRSAYLQSMRVYQDLSGDRFAHDFENRGYYED